MTGPTAAAALPAEVETLMRQLRLPHARAIAADVLATARSQRWDPTEVIKAPFMLLLLGIDKTVAQQNPVHSRTRRGLSDHFTLQLISDSPRSPALVIPAHLADQRLNICSDAARAGMRTT